MNEIVTVDDFELSDLLDQLHRGYSVRFAIEGGGLKVSVNQGIWTLPYGVQA